MGAFRNIETKAFYRVESLKGKICSGNRIGTLKQITGKCGGVREVD